MTTFVRTLWVFGFVLCLQGAWAQQTWHTLDIGNTGAPGAASYASGVFTVSGAGGDINGAAADAFRYLYQGSSGNATIIARIITVENTPDQAEAGVMLRAGLDAESQNACIVVTSGKEISFQWRSAKGTCGNQSLTRIFMPCWVKLTQNVNSYTAFYSADGSKWTQLGSAVTIEMTGPMYLGMAVTNHGIGKCCCATFDNVQISRAAIIAAAPVGPAPVNAVMIGLLAGLEKGPVTPDAPSGCVTLNNDSRALRDGGTGWTRKAEYVAAACALDEKTDFTADIQMKPLYASRWVCKAYYSSTTPGYEKPTLFLYADRFGAGQCATRQLPDKTAVTQWVLAGELRMARLPQARHGYRMWVTVKSGDRDVCHVELKDNSQWESGGSTLMLKAGDAGMTLLEDKGVYTGCQSAKTDIFGQAFTPFTLTAAAGNIILRLGDKAASLPVTEWQHPTAVEFGCHTATDAVEFGIGNLQFCCD